MKNKSRTFTGTHWKLFLNRSFAATLGIVFCAGCSYYVPATLETSHMGDTLQLALSGYGASRWDPQKDSLVIECTGCTEESARMVEHFRSSSVAEYDFGNSQGLTLNLYSMGTVQTETIPGEAAGIGTVPHLIPIPERHARRTRREERTAETPPPPPAASSSAAPVNVEPEVKKAAPTSVKVTAAEGVAIYKDKTKTEVLKIVPQGTALTLLSKEGDLYSVSVDGEEGFVDAAAVTEQ